MTLRDVIGAIGDLDDESVILIESGAPWSAESKVLVRESTEYEENRELFPGFLYFLEIYIAKEVLEVLRDRRKHQVITPDDEIEAVIYYAQNDAYLE